MPYQLRFSGRAPVSFQTEPEAIEAAQACLADDPEAEPEVIDLATGRACAPGSTKAWREEMKQRVGF